MAHAAREAYASDLHRLTGVIVAPPGAGTAPAPFASLCGDHPVPGRASALAGKALMEAAGATVAGDVVIVLVSGGGSALAVAPRAGTSLDDLAALHAAMVARGMDVRDMNLVRRHVDDLKGGGLARMAAAATVRSFVVSDVVGDDPADVASGPTVASRREPRRALDLLERYGVEVATVRRMLRAEADASVEPTLHTDSAVSVAPGDCLTEVVVSASSCLQAAARSLVDDGAVLHSLQEAVVGDARRQAVDLAREVAAVRKVRANGADALRDVPVVLVSGGETTVHVRGRGTGGRNQTFALALALALPDRAPVHALVADSDGLDGVGGAAGAFVGPSTFDVVSRAEATAMLADDDSGGFFRANGDAWVTGATGTNVNDLRFVWVAPEEAAPVEWTGFDRAPHIVTPSRWAIDQAVAALRSGRLVAMPTETVYGLAARASDPQAVASIYAAKGRPSDHPVIVHVGDAAQLSQWTDADAELVDRWIRRFWPGPLTLVLPARAQVSRAITGGQDTVAVRMPAHPVALALLRALGEAVVAPSANRFGHVSPTTAEHVIGEFPDLDLLVLDGGPCDVGIESTILDLTGAVPRTLRPGGVTLRRLREVEPTVEPTVEAAAEPAPSPAVPRVPGALARHYAPISHTTVVDVDALRRPGSLRPEEGLLCLSFRPDPGREGPTEVLADDPVTYARGLYAALRRLDAARPPRIVVERPPDDPAWAGIHDRLRRATAGAGALDVHDVPAPREAREESM